MTKRRINNDIEKLTEEQLGDLEPENWYALLLKSIEKDREHWRELLIETLPMGRYRAKDMAYVNRTKLLDKIARTAVYQLHTTCLEFELIKQERTTEALIELLGTSDDETFEPNQLSGDGLEPQELVADLYLMYESYRRFAEEFVGVDLETWLAVHQDGPAVVDATEEGIATNQELLEDADEDLPHIPDEQFDLSRDELPDELPKGSLDRLALRRYEELVELLTESLEAITPEA